MDMSPLQPGWLIVDGRPVYHRSCVAAGDDAPTLVHVHGFGISGTYLTPTAKLLASRFRTFIPDLPGMGRSMRPEHPLDLPGLARALISYCDAVGVEKATFVGNSLGCPILVEVATTFPERIDRLVLVSPAGGLYNRPLWRAVMQMAIDGTREPLALLPIAVRDYMNFGLLQGFKLFKAMIEYPTVERVRNLIEPTLVIAGHRDPLIDFSRVVVFSGLPHIDAVKVQGAHALNFSRPEVTSALIDAYMSDQPLRTVDGVLSSVEILEIPDAA